MNTDKVLCPICAKEFASSVIESHASKCLFLNEPTKENTILFKDSSPRSIRSKLKPASAKKTNQISIKRKSSLDQFSSQSFRDEEDAPQKSTENECKKLRGNGRDVPLAEQMRPTSLLNFVGQRHILGPRTILSELLQKGEIPNMILWGPPGCGKTSLANVIAHMCKNDASRKLRYVKLSAAMAGVQEVKEVISIASNHAKYAQHTIVFMDEIHRFNKMQQDVFLPHVESGIITLIGATTENPSFSLNSALLSRCRVIVLHKLSIANLLLILKRAVISLGGIIHAFPNKSESTLQDIGEEDTLEKNKVIEMESSCNTKFIIDEPTIEWLAETCDGDARIALGGLEMAVRCKAPNEKEFLDVGPAIITLDDIKESLKKTHMLYDKKGEQHYDTISALHKSVRASDENASLYWLTRMIAGGEDPVYIARRLVRMASEDIGLADPKALGIAVHTMHGCKMIGMPECDVLLAQCTTYLARAPKSRLMEDALRAAQKIIAEHKGPQPGVPLHLRNAPTRLMKDLEYGKGYNMMHKDESGLNYLPEGLENLDFFGDDDDDN
ncbi:PREDICTED: ATPase WRNIP1-like [Acromyrmex echinatior]|uniref:ATPase WRNIP1-like n=1 Tax=Acromyrmex echinatior TaxID=103372 RepID=UPI0005810245|nr:PREDICTED: ATPase WRNIP1-like [Acromyrmex echinatior]XP_011053384.1 PREDICTED: ATPase WRNIP1-like [Acromyrmex echinatior]XP_011053385.1 PREDICTED: ATPase WRNIP1-like [Acromyrmex echinatior]XP_011053386.1 PREDICTED: ATPase WRNIP1-like [Acromyrmex echinatior]